MYIPNPLALIHNAPRKCMALFVGYHVWLLISSALPAYRWLEVPICFYPDNQKFALEAPETLRVLLTGNRTTLYYLDTAALAVHINTQILQPGKNSISLSSELLLLPRTIHVAQWAPSNLMITAQERS